MRSTVCRILILGGTGFLGPALVDAARVRGHRLTLFNRGVSNSDRSADVETLYGDRRSDLSALRGRTWDVVIDTSRDVPSTMRASVELLESAVERYVFISTVSVYALPRPAAGADESAPLVRLAPGTEPQETSPETYGAIKALDEQVLEATMPGRGLVIRPGLIAGPGDATDRFTYWPARLAEGGEVLAPGNPSDPVQLIDVRDLARWTIAMCEERVVGIFNAVGPRFAMGMGEMIAACQRATRSTARITWVDAKFLEEHAIEPWSDMPVWIPGESEDASFARTKIERAVARGLTFRPLEATATDTLAWYGTLSEARRVNANAGLTRERETEVLAAYRRAGRSVDFR